MKKLLLFFLFSGSLDGFSQVYRPESTEEPVLIQAPDGTYSIKRPEPKPDTLRAIVLVTLFPNGVAHSRMGFVVIEQDKRPVYLDCQKKALKLPQVGWGYELVNPNKKLK